MGLEIFRNFFAQFAASYQLELPLKITTRYVHVRVSQVAVIGH